MRFELSNLYRKLYDPGEGFCWNDMNLDIEGFCQQFAIDFYIMSQNSFSSHSIVLIGRSIRFLPDEQIIANHNVHNAVVQQ